jgi:methanogenic corrinoid protein MtbC1
MTDPSASTLITLSISAVERDTGLSKDTLRVWERRYGFPLPPARRPGRARVLARRRRTAEDHSPSDGCRPPAGKIIGLSDEQLQALAVQSAGAAHGAASPADTRDDLSRFIDLVKAHDVEALRTGLSQTALRMGLERFVKEVSAPLNTRVGEAWARGYLEVFEEHLYTESMQVVLRNAIGTIPMSGQHPRVLLTTFPNELHGLGLLMAEALLALDGCRCASLGTQTPVWDIVRAASAKPIDIVALSFSACLNANQVLDGLVELRAKLPDTVELWAGGQCPVLQRRPPANVTVLSSLSDIAPAVRRWRSARQTGGPSGLTRIQATNSDSTPV